jgi:DNA-binding MurR/RpiR family transcriptional regulator
VTVTEAKPPSLQERVAARRGTLTATERRIAEYLTAHLHEAAFSSAEELGRASGTSDASVVRTARSLGFDGLPDLKRSLQRHLGSLLSTDSRLTKSLQSVGGGPGSVLTATLHDQIERLQEAERSVDPAQFGHAVELIDHARETVICGSAGLAGVLEYTATRLTRIGCRATAASDTGYRLADRLLLIRPEDVVIVVAYDRVTQENRVVLDHAARLDVPVILLTDTLGEALRDEVAVVLSAPMSRPGAFTGQATVLILLEALTIAVAAKDRERSLDTTTRMIELRDELNDHPPTDETVLHLPEPKVDHRG